MKEKDPVAWTKAEKTREALRAATGGRESLETALDRERRRLMRANEIRLERYERAAAGWAAIWPRVNRQNSNLPLSISYRNLIAAAEGVLPYEP